MKKQMKSSLFAVAMSLSLFGAMLSSSSDDAKVTVAGQVPTLQEQAVETPESASFADEIPKIPFTFYLTLVTSFTNGTPIDFNAMDAEGQSFIWDSMSKWGEKQ